MSYITLTICLMLLAHSLFIYKTKILNPFTLFYAMWSAIIFLSILNLYGIYRPSFEAYFALCIMFVCFMIGGTVGRYFKFKVSGFAFSWHHKEAHINLKLFYLLSVLFIIFTLIDCLIVLKGYINHVPAWQIRSWRMATYGTDNPILNRRTFAEEIFRSVLLSPFETLVYPIVSYMLMHKDKNNRIIYVFAIAILLLSSFAGGGGRLSYLYIVGCVLLAYTVFIKKINISNRKKKKFKRIIFFAMLLSFIAVVLFTQLRTGKGNFIKQAYTYFALPPTLLSIWLKDLKGISHTYGMLSTFGIHSYFFRALQAIKMDFLVPEIYNTTFQHILNAEKFRDAGYGIANAFVTPVYYFYIDGGYIFTAIGSLLFGFIVSKVYMICVSNMDIKKFTYYCLIMNVVFMTFMRFQLCMPSCVISFILVNFIISPRKD